MTCHGTGPRQRDHSEMARRSELRRTFVLRAHGGTELAPLASMHALEFEGEQLASERPTMPVPAPRESEVRLIVSRIAYSAATVDVVVCDLSRDSRSEDYISRVATSGFALARCRQNERPPSTSIVRALK
jgi:hypothetical protein